MKGDMAVRSISASISLWIARSAPRTICSITGSEAATRSGADGPSCMHASSLIVSGDWTTEPAGPWRPALTWMFFRARMQEVGAGWASWHGGRMRRRGGFGGRGPRPRGAHHDDDPV